MVKTLLDEVRAAPLDERSRVRLREIYEQSIHDLAEGLSPDLVAELEALAPPFDSEAPSEAELRIAQAQLVGLARGAVPRDPGHLDVPADGGPGPARRDATARLALGRRVGRPHRRLSLTRGSRPRDGGVRGRHTPRDHRRRSKAAAGEHGPDRVTRRTVPPAGCPHAPVTPRPTAGPPAFPTQVPTQGGYPPPPPPQFDRRRSMRRGASVSGATSSTS